MKIDLAKCKGCGYVGRSAPSASSVEGKKVQWGRLVECRHVHEGLPQGRVYPGPPDKTPVCAACPIAYRVPEGCFGACMRYYNEAGAISRKARSSPMKRWLTWWSPPMRPSSDGRSSPASVSGTTYPDFRPSPFIVSGVRDGIDIVRW